MTTDGAPSAADNAAATPAQVLPLGGALRRAWIGYQHRLDDQLAAAGFDRRFPDGRVLRLCAGSEAMTISQVGRYLGMTRQGAAKIVNGLAARGYVEVSPSQTSGREKVVRLTARARAYLDAHRASARRVEADLRAALGPETFDALARLLDVLGADGDERMSDYLRRRSDPGGI